MSRQGVKKEVGFGDLFKYIISCMESDRFSKYTIPVLSQLIFH
jgi:hypothetical protein